jgi:hypothetical protein
MKKIILFIFIKLSLINIYGQLPVNWEGDSDIDIFQEANNVYGGEYSAGIIVNSGTQANCDFHSKMEIPVIGGESFKMSFWGHTSEFVRIRAKVVWSNGSTHYAMTYLGPNTGGWIEYSFENIVPDDATGAYVGVRFYDVSGFAPGEIQYVDAITFESPVGNVIAVENGDFESWQESITEITEDFETYSAGQKIVQQALAQGVDYWTCWSGYGGAGTAEDGTVTDEVAVGGENSVMCDGTNDFIMLFGDKTEGKYGVSFDMYVPSGFVGYYNILQAWGPGGSGAVWGLEVYFNPGGIAELTAENTTPLQTFSYPYNT